MNKTTSLIIGIILLIAGLFYAVFPHSIHISSGIGFGLPHSMHVPSGIVLLVVGGIMLWKMKK